MRFLLFFVLLLSLSCHHKKDWQYTPIRSLDSNYDMAKLSYPASSASKGILLELIRQHKEIQGYLNVHTFEMPYYKDNPHLAKINFKAGKEECSFIVDRLTGGQRLHLSQPSFIKLTNLLREYPEVTIQVGHYFQKIHSTTFNKKYNKLCKYSLYWIPERIVTFELY